MTVVVMGQYLDQHTVTADAIVLVQLDDAPRSVHAALHIKADRARERETESKKHVV